MEGKVRSSAQARVGLTLVTAASIGWLAGCAADFERHVPPLPDPIRIVQPAADVPPELAAFSGLWLGTWRTPQGEVREHALLVEEVTAASAKVAYSPGASGSWFRMTGRFDSGDGVSLVFEWPNPRGEHLSATYHLNRDGSIHAIFRFPLCSFETEHHARCLVADMVKASPQTIAKLTTKPGPPDEQSLRAREMTPLTQQQLEERYARRFRARYESDRGGRGTITFMPDGSVQVSGTLDDTGTWRIRDGRLCTKYVRIRQGEEACFTLFRTGEREITYFLANDSVAGTYTELD